MRMIAGGRLGRDRPMMRLKPPPFICVMAVGVPRPIAMQRSWTLYWKVEKGSWEYR